MLETQEFLTMLFENKIPLELITSVYKSGQEQTEYGYSIEDYYRTYGVKDVYSYFILRKDFVDLFLKYHHNYSFTDKDGLGEFSSMFYGGIILGFKNSSTTKVYTEEVTLSSEVKNILTLMFCNGCDSSIIKDFLADFYISKRLKSEEFNNISNNKDLLHFLFDRSINNSLHERRELINNCPLIQALLEINSITFQELDKCTSSANWEESLETLVQNKAIEVLKEDSKFPQGFTKRENFRYILNKNPNSFIIFVVPAIKSLQNKTPISSSLKEVKTTYPETARHVIS